MCVLGAAEQYSHIAYQLGRGVRQIFRPDITFILPSGRAISNISKGIIPA